MAQEPFVLYHAPGSRSIRVRWTLEEMGLPYTLERVDFTYGDVGGEAYKAINPLQKVPALKDGQATLLESLAIVEYLIATYGPTPLAVRPDEPDYARYLEWLHFGEATMSMAVNLLIAHTALLPERHRNEKLAQWARAETHKQLACLAERGLADGRRWLAQARLTAADISLGYMLFLLKIMKQFDGAPPAVAAYFDRIRALDSWKKASAD